jgi:hypothetical protein
MFESKQYLNPKSAILIIVLCALCLMLCGFDSSVYGSSNNDGSADDGGSGDGGTDQAQGEQEEQTKPVDPCNVNSNLTGCQQYDPRVR